MKFFEQLQKLLTHPFNKDKKLQTLFRIFWWKINQKYFKIPAILSITKDARLICYPESSYGSYVVYAKFPEYEEMNFINSFITDGNIIIDVGANLADISILSASKGENVRVFCFEPTEKLIQLINENILINHFEKRISVFQKAVSNINGKIHFTLEQESEISHISIDNRLEKNSIEVESTTLDTFAEQHSINHIDLLKVDVEGAELFVFQGAKKLLKNQKIDCILFEFNKNIPRFGYSKSELIYYLLNKDYFVFKFDQDSKLSLVSNNFKSRVFPRIAA